MHHFFRQMAFLEGRLPRRPNHGRGETLSIDSAEKVPFGGQK